MDKIILNLGGEGEIPGFINVNNLESLRRTFEDFKADGPLIVHNILEPWPFANDSIDEIFANCLPGFSIPERHVILKEAFRVLKTGSKARMHSHSVSKFAWRTSMESVGFINITFEISHQVGHAVGIKPTRSMP